MKFSVITSTYNQLAQLNKVYEALRRSLYTDFEWIIADDGSSDGTKEFVDNLKEPWVKYVSQPDDGYRLTEILNKAGRIAQGQHIVWIMGDSYPKDDFLKELSSHVAEDKVLNGLRLNVDNLGTIISPDWRVERVMFDLEVDEALVNTPRPWELMTLNSFCMPRSAYERMGGIYPEYKGYGRMDWDMAAWAFYHGMKLYWVPKAVIYHEAHKEREDTEENIRIFAKRLEEFQAPQKAHDERIKQKMEIINDPKRAEDKRQQMLKKRAETEHILEQGATDDEI